MLQSSKFGADHNQWLAIALTGSKAFGLAFQCEGYVLGGTI
jgi:hypothetical protein